MSVRDLLSAASGSAVGDPNFKNVSLLLTGDGTNGAQNNTFLDSSTNNFTITRNGNATQGTFSPYGNLWSNYFDGSGDYLTVPDNAAFDFGSGNFTIEGWINISSSAGIKSICSKIYDFGPFLFAVDGTTVKYWLSSTGSSWNIANGVSGGTISVGSWTHVALVRNGTSVTAYVNGVAGTTTTTSATLVSNTRVLSIGADQTSGSGFVQFANGYISNLRIVKGTALYTSNFTPSTTPLTAVSGTSLLTCQSNRFIDNSSNNFTLTVNGNTSVQRFSPFNPTAPYSAATIGGSGYFDGTGDYLALPSNNSAFQMGTGAYTIEGWVYLTAYDTYSQPLFESGNATNSLGLFVTGTIVGTQGAVIINKYGVGEVISTASGIVPLNTWTHIAAVRTSTGSNDTRIYVNGVLRATGTDSNNWTVSTNPTIGSLPAFTTYDINGYISNLRVVKGTAVYTSAFTPPTTPLTSVSGTSLLLNFTNAGIPDAAMMNDLETVGNAQVSTSVKKYGTGSLYFDGTGDWLTMAATPQLINSGSFTVEFWVNFTSNPSNYIALLGGTSANTQFFITTKSNGQGLRFGLTGVAEYAAGTQAWTTGTWYHVALVRNGTDVKFYVNGTNVSDSTYTNSTSYSGVLQIGGNLGIADFNGYIDDLRITKGLARYTSNFTPPTAALPTY